MTGSYQADSTQGKENKPFVSVSAILYSILKVKSLMIPF